MINDMLDAKHRGWQNASQHSKRDNVQQLGEERKKMINDALDAKHWGWQNASQHSEQDNVRQLGEERKKMINDALDAKHRGWQNASQHSKQDNVQQLGEERKKVINDPLDAKHQGWQNASQHNKRNNMRQLGEERKKMINDLLDAKHWGWQNASQHSKLRQERNRRFENRESRQHAAARLNKIVEMVCKYVNGQYIFHQPCGLWNAPCVHSCGYIHLLSSTPGSRKKCCANGPLSSATPLKDESRIWQNYFCLQIKINLYFIQLFVFIWQFSGTY